LGYSWLAIDHIFLKSYVIKIHVHITTDVRNKCNTSKVFRLLVKNFQGEKGGFDCFIGVYLGSLHHRSQNHKGKTVIIQGKETKEIK